MILIIREYLSLLKESEELDRLLPDLLLAMNIEPFSKPQPGVRQHGVDIAAIGKDADGIEKVFLLVLKRGDLGRSQWDSGSQAIRQTLDEIKDVYLTSRIKQEHEHFPKKIILCTGGDLKQDVQENWNGYVKKNLIRGEIEYEFWGGDRLSFLLMQHIFNEQILPADLRSKFRKTLALLGEADYKLNDYYYLLDKLLFHPESGSGKPKHSPSNVIKRLRLLNLCLTIIFFWSKQEDNLKPAILSAERTILLVWEFMRQNELMDDKTVAPPFLNILNTLFNIYSEYFIKIQKHCFVENGLAGYGGHFIQRCINIFEQLGIVSTFGVILLWMSAVTKNSDMKAKSAITSETVKALINNHLATFTPCFDNHIIEISITIYLLVIHGEKKFIEQWITEIINHITFSYRNMGKYFPIQSDSFDDLVALNISRKIKKEKLMEISTLIPILTQWCGVLGLENTYKFVKNAVSKVFNKTTLQIWYPDEETDKHIYKENAAIDSGVVDAPIILFDSMEEMIIVARKVREAVIKPELVSSISKNFIILPLIASRHFRTPILPYYWQRFLGEEKPK